MQYVLARYPRHTPLVSVPEVQEREEAMKTEQMIYRLRQDFSIAAQHEIKLNAILEEFALDAFKAGMTEAASELRSLAKVHSSPSIIMLLKDSAQTIEKARDSKTSV